MRTLRVTEGEWFSVDRNLRGRVRTAFDQARERLRPRDAKLNESEGRLQIWGVIGALQLTPQVLLEVAPKVGAEDDWVRATLDLLVGSDRVGVAGERAGGRSGRRRDILDALAEIYADRLARAVRRDGPVLLMRRERAVLPHLRGRLDATAWARRAGYAPHRFPVEYSRLTADHEVSVALATVAHSLARATALPSVRGSLLSSARALRPGLPEGGSVSPAVATQRLPPQWAAYAPAWSIASALLTQRAPLGPRGPHAGVSIAIEAWPLLERLVERALRAAVRQAGDQGRVLEPSFQEGQALLAPHPDSNVSSKSVRPEGVLREGSRVLATFEAKYSLRGPRSKWPRRGHYFQALATAAAYDSELAVLVYPEAFESEWWTVEGFEGCPQRMAAVGLGLFSYERGIGDELRGTRLLDLLRGPGPARPAVTA